MAKDESKKEKRAKRKSEGAVSAVGDDTAMSVDPVADEPKVKKEKKDKKIKLEEDDDAADDVPVGAISPIAQPLAQKKLAKKVYKMIKKASKQRGHVKRGVKEVVKGLRKGEKGLVILAGDISPVDILSHIPVLCEDTDNPYIFVTSKDALGAASSTKRPTSCVMIVPGGSKKKGAAAAAAGTANGADPGKEEYADDYKTVYAEAKTMGEQVVLGTA